MFWKDMLERFIKTLGQSLVTAGIWVPADNTLHIPTTWVAVASVITMAVLSMGTSLLSRGVGSSTSASAAPSIAVVSTTSLTHPTNATTSSTPLAPLPTTPLGASAP